MANDCSNKLVVLDLQCSPSEFKKSLELAIYGKEVDEEEYYAVYPFAARPGEYLFKTKWEPPVNALVTLSKCHSDATFLLDFRCWESDFRGQLVIQNGEVTEYVRRAGYCGPSFLWSDITHPVIDLFSAHPQHTLAESATQRLQDAIQIVAGLKETLEDKRFTSSRYRAFGSSDAVSKAVSELKEMMDGMIARAAEISFDGVLLEESELDTQESSGLNNLEPQTLDDVEDL
jgi:hypothetical protein